VIDVRPSVGTLSQATVGKQVQDTLGQQGTQTELDEVRKKDQGQVNITSDTTTSPHIEFNFTMEHLI